MIFVDQPSASALMNTSAYTTVTMPGVRERREGEEGEGEERGEGGEGKTRDDDVTHLPMTEGQLWTG